jgi:hypothetical protein
MRGCMRATAFGAAIAASLALSVPTASAEGCADTCSVGLVGTGGENSDGQAQGFRLKGLSGGFPGSTFTNQGNEMAGHIAVTGPFEGSASGRVTPDGTLVGHFDGVSAIFFGLDGDCSGVCVPAP